MTATSTLVFIDSETTSLRPDRRAWNIGLIRRVDGIDQPGEEVIIRDVDLTEADPIALRIGHFWERHPMVGGDPGEADGAVPSFDAETFTDMFWRHELCWPAHYHLIDAEVAALGALAARGQLFEPPYSSDDLSTALGVDRYARHTALGDAAWARDLYDAAMRPI